MYRLPSSSLNSTFLNCFEECYDDCCNKKSSHIFWRPFPRPLFFSYHNEIMQQYSTVEVSGAGSADVNGMYYPVGWLNKSFVWQNDQNMYLSRELIGNQLGWLFGNVTVAYYGICTVSLFPPSTKDWKCYSGKEPSPSVICKLKGECVSSFELRNTIKTGLTSIQWTPSMEIQYLLFLYSLFIIRHNLCEEWYFTECTFNESLRMMRKVYISGIADFFHTLRSPLQDDDVKSTEKRYNCTQFLLFII